MPGEGANRWLEEAQLAATEVARGLRSFCGSVVLIATSPKLRWCCLSHTPWLVVGALVVAVPLWVLTWPLGWLGLEVGWDGVLRAVVLFALSAMRGVIPHFFGQSFFAVLQVRDPAFGRELQNLPVLQTVWGHLRDLLLALLLAGVFGGVALVLAPVLLPYGAALLAVLAASWMMWVPVVVGSAFLITSCVFCCAPLLELASMYNLVKLVDPVLALVVVVAAIICLSGRGTLFGLATSGVYLYLASVKLTKQLLTQFAIREKEQTWTAFTTRQRWGIFGFGLPISITAQWYPILALAFLELFHGAAAALLVDLRNRDEELRGRDDTCAKNI